jgi:hypothetical protein
MVAHLRKGRRESAIQSILYSIVSSLTTPSAGERPVHTESHGDDAHHAGEAHLRLRLMVQAIALGAYTILLVVVGVAWDELVGVDLLDVFHADVLCFGVRGVHAAYFCMISMCVQMSKGPDSLEAL